MINILFFLCCLVTCTTSQRVDGMQNTPIKSIQTEFGYIVDCIDINKQPAFNHPLLKNHKLQRKPSIQSIIEKPTGLKGSKPAFGLETPCPKGTVPIRRATENNLIRTTSISDAPQGPGNHVAEVHLPPHGTYYGVQGTANIWNPHVESNQSSEALVFVRNGPTTTSEMNEIVVGWHVFPQLYNGDFGTYFFAGWTADDYKTTGCYNAGCGYVQVDQTRYLGAHLTQTSFYDRNIFDIQVAIYKDPVTQNWWLNVDNTNIGYFPMNLFTNMPSADQVGWGGRTITTPGTASPPMGSGFFPEKNLLRSASFRNVFFKNELLQQFQKPEDHIMEAFSDSTNCYKVDYYGYQEKIGTILEFGGPGGNC